VVYRPESESDYYVERGVLTEETLAGALADVVASHGQRIAISEIGLTLRYRDLDDITDRAAGALLRLGLRPLDRVVFQLANSKELVLSYVASLKAGLIPICTLAAHRKHEIGYLARHAGARAHFIDGDVDKFDFISFAREVRAEVSTMQHVVAMRARGQTGVDNIHGFEQLIAGIDRAEARTYLNQVDLDPWQVAIFQLSGGTTGVPKIIPRFHNEYLYSIRAMMRFEDIDETIVAYTPSPLMHNAPMICYWGPALFSGGEIAVTPSLDPEVIGTLLAERRPNWICAPAAILLRLKSAGVLDRLSFHNVKAFTVPGGVPAIEKMTGAPVVPLFGMTEGLICYGRPDDPREALIATVGRPVCEHDQLRLLRPGTEEDCAEGEIGELVCKGPNVIQGYFDAEERNKEAFTSDMFYRSGDLCGLRTIGGKRFITFEGRLKDVVSRGGEKINCMEVETAASTHPKIGSIAIVPMPDPAYEERACAFVILTPGADTLSVEELGSFLEQAGMAKFKWPERIEIVSDFPMTSSGKISKPKLKEIIAAQVEREGAARPAAPQTAKPRGVRA
jgi:non-ribosomal peptide synthetase component E (peptide arylation enzyme)